MLQQYCSNTAAIELSIWSPLLCQARAEHVLTCDQLQILASRGDGVSRESPFRLQVSAGSPENVRLNIILFQKFKSIASK
jgi:hypothetical protein